MPLSGKEMLRLFLKSGWVILRQRGSHLTVGKIGKIVVIPMHRELKKGTEHGLIKQLKKSEDSE